MRTIVEPGDVFVDADGLAWVGVNEPKLHEAREAHLVYFTAKAGAFTPTDLNKWLEENDKIHPESDPSVRIPISVLRQPFTLIAELRTWRG